MTPAFEDPVHPVIDRPYEYRIQIMHYDMGGGEREAWLELELKHCENASRRRLRFWSPSWLSIEEGFPAPTGGMVILDVSARQLEGVGVQVVDLEGNHGAIRFSARRVEERPLSSSTLPEAHDPGGS